MSGATVELLKVLLRQVSEESGVAGKLIATVDDLESIASSDRAEVPALSGWRRKLFGDRALELKHGRLALTVENGKVVTLEWKDAEAGERRTRPLEAGPIPTAREAALSARRGYRLAARRLPPRRPAGDSRRRGSSGLVRLCPRRAGRSGRPLGGAAKWRLAKSLKAMEERLAPRGARLDIMRGDAEPAILALAAAANASRVLWTRRYEGGRDRRSTPASRRACASAASRP